MDKIRNMIHKNFKQISTQKFIFYTFFISILIFNFFYSHIYIKDTKRGEMRERPLLLGIGPEVY